MKVERFFKQQATWEKRTGTDDYGGNVYSSGKSIWVRWFSEDSVVRDDTSRQTTSVSRLSTLEPIKTGDRITDESARQREVIDVRLNRSVAGYFSHYVVYLA